MSKKPRWVVALLAGATLAVPASAQVVRREGRTPLVVDRPTAVPAGPLIDTEFPAPGQTVSGVVTVSGFVLDLLAVDRIELFVDDSSEPVDRAVMNLPRPEILTAFPAYAASNPAPGWMSSFLARNYSDGPHDLFLAVTESGPAGTVFYGPITVNVDNTINQRPFGKIDVPGSGATFAASGPLPVLGWALDDSDIDHVDFLVDGGVMASAIGRGGVENAFYGATRPDIYAAFPDFPGPNPASLYSGFLANLDTTQLLNGMHTLTVRAYDNQGASSEIGSVQFQAMNNGGLLVPFGEIDYPMDEATLICGPSVPVIPPGGPCPSPCFPGGGGGVPVSFFPNIVKGWALDTGARMDQGQVSYVELMLDGALLANTRSQCTVTGNIFANCYGLSRPDIAHEYQGFVNSANAGFQFNFGLSRDPFLGLLDIIIPDAARHRARRLHAARQAHALGSGGRRGEHGHGVRRDVGQHHLRRELQPGPGVLWRRRSADPGPVHQRDLPGLRLGVRHGWSGQQPRSRDRRLRHRESERGQRHVRDSPRRRADQGQPRDVALRRIRVPAGHGPLGDSQHDLTIYANSGSYRTLIGRRQFVVFNNSANKQ